MTSYVLVDKITKYSHDMKRCDWFLKFLGVVRILKYSHKKCDWFLKFLNIVIKRCDWFLKFNPVIGF